MNPSVESSSVSVDDAVIAASHAARPLARMLPESRAAMLDGIADALDAHVDELITIADEETSLGEVRLRGEVARTSGQLRLFGSVLRDGAYLEATIDHAEPGSTPPKPDLRRQLVALGPVAVFTASNFPFAFSVLGGDTASALAAGCPVVVKAHSGHLRLSRRTAQVAQHALAVMDAPEGTLTHVEGREAGRQLVIESSITAVGFTGSLGGGRALFDLAVGRPDPIPFYGELSSLNPVVISESAARERAHELAEGLTASFTLGVGQFCTKPGVVFVPEGHDLIAELKTAVSATSPAPMLMPRLLASFQDGIQGLAQTPGVDVVVPAATELPEGCASAQVYTTRAATLIEHPEATLDEQFGPAVLLVRYNSMEQLLAAIDVLPGTLTSTIHADAEELDALEPLIERLQDLSGRLIFNGWPTGVAVNWAMQHGGPWPSTTNTLHTSVGSTAIRRFLRPVSFQNADERRLPPALQDDNPLAVPRRIDGVLTV